MTRLLVVIGADCDPDRPDFGGAAYSERRLSWRGLEVGVPRAAEAARGVCGPGPTTVDFKVTWCVRSDPQIGDLYGSCAWCWGEYQHVWDELRSDGHEIAWHPHVWRWDSSARCWFQETEDRGWTMEALQRGYGEGQAHAGALTSCRTGWNYHSALTMRVCDELGVEVDFSALPGESSAGFLNDRGSRFHGAFDWQATPLRPFHPGVIDHRRPAPNAEGALSLLEVPLTTTASVMARGLIAARNLARRRTLAFPRRHAFRITAPPRLFRCSIRQALRDHARFDTGILGAYFHPDELLSDGTGAPGIYSANHMRTNLENAISEAHRRGIEVIPATASEVAGFLQEDESTRSADERDEPAPWGSSAVACPSRASTAEGSER